MEKSQNFFEVAGNQQETEQEKKWEIAIEEIKNLKVQWHNLLVEKKSDMELAQELDRTHDVFKQKFVEAGINSVDIRRVAAFHVLIGSTPEYSRSEQIDFEGDLSIKKFLEEEIEKLQK